MRSKTDTLEKMFKSVERNSFLYLLLVDLVALCIGFITVFKEHVEPNAY